MRRAVEAGLGAAGVLCGLSAMICVAGPGCSSKSNASGDDAALSNDSSTTFDDGAADGVVADTTVGQDVTTAMDSGVPLDSASGDSATSHDSSVSPEGSPVVDAGADAVCDGAIPTLPDLTTGHWVICNATDTAGRIWTGILTISTETLTCSGADLTGSFDWSSTNIGNYSGTTLAQGTYVASTQLITLDEYQVEAGSVLTATDTMTYDPNTGTLVNGGWTCSCHNGSWSVAVRQPADAGAVCNASDAATD